MIVTDEFAGWYAELSGGHRESVIHSVGLLEQMGTQLPFPHSHAVLVLGGAKVGDDRFYRWFIPQAENVWEQYLKEQGVTP